MNKETSTVELKKAKRQKSKKWKEEKLLKKLKKEEPLADDEPEEEKIKETKSEVKIASTISIAVPGSILDNAQSGELRSYLVGQIARAACIFQIDEIIVFDDQCGSSDNAQKTNLYNSNGSAKKTKQCCVQFARILQYLECPQYLRKYFFPIHNDLKFAGILNPLDAPHHLRQTAEFEFREGVITNKPVKECKGSYVNVGLFNDVFVEKALSPGLRVTVRLLSSQNQHSKKLRGEIVAPDVPRAETGIYWGYSVRIADSLSQVFSQSPFKDGYDLTVGTSDKGSNIDDITDSLSFNHALIVFGGLDGLESALENDEVLTTDEPADLFDHYLNTLPKQGSRTIRTEEAILVTLAALRTKLKPQTIVSK